jgi:hypothetical protein
MDRMKPVVGALCVCWIGAGQLRPHPSGKIRRVLCVSKAKQASERGTPSVSHGVPAERPQGRTQASDSSPGANRAVRPARGGGSCCTIPDRAACESRGPAGRQGAGVLPRVRQRRVLQGGEQPRGRPAETRAPRRPHKQRARQDSGWRHPGRPPAVTNTCATSGDSENTREREIWEAAAGRRAGARSDRRAGRWAAGADTVDAGVRGTFSLSLSLRKRASELKMALCYVAGAGGAGASRVM